MSLALALAVGGLVAVGTYLVTARSLSRIVLGFSLLGHAAVVGLIAAGGRAGPVRDYSAAKGSDLAAFRTFQQTMLAHGVYLAPSQFEAGFVSTAHDETAIQRTLDAARAAFEQVAQARASE